jgi:poly-gamma-glutamate synthesis protein (capsule biosynthesis protein)
MLYDAERGDIVIALTGESLITRRLSVFKEEGFLKLVQMIRDADVSFTNAECVFHDYEAPPWTFPGGMTGAGIYMPGTYMASPSWCIKELQWAGINMVATPNNHTSDFGEAGLLASIRHLDAYGMLHAGSGRNLREARSPAYLDTNQGRVALIASAAWGPRGRGHVPWPEPMGVIAAEQSPYSPGRPGLNLIRHRVVFTVDREAFDTLRRISKELGHEEGARELALRDNRNVEPNLETELYFQGTKFVLGNGFSMKSIADPVDLAENLKWVRDARRMADWVLYSYHDHGICPSLEVPGDHNVEVAHSVIDNGGDVLIGHGPHRDRGIEIYKGKPIFHSLGDDFFDARVASGGDQTSVRGWESVIAIVTFKAKKLREIRLYPVDLGMKNPRGQCGRPVLAEPGGDVSNRVLKGMQQMSEPYGTNIEIRDGVGVISVN